MRITPVHPIMATLVIMSIIVGDIPIVVVYEKKMFGF
jgi:hypothetical protein